MSTIRETAEMLADANLESEPNLKRIYLFPSQEEIRLVEVDDTAQPTQVGSVLTPFYFGPNKTSGIEYQSAIALIRPEEERRIKLPDGWGDWASAELLREVA